MKKILGVILALAACLPLACGSKNSPATPSLTQNNSASTSTSTAVLTFTGTASPSATTTGAVTASRTPTASFTAIGTATSAPSQTFTPTSSATSTATVTVSLTPSFTPASTSSFTATASPTVTWTATLIPTLTVTSTPTITSTPITLSAAATLGGGTYFKYPTGIQYGNGDLWVTDNSNNNLQEWVTNGSGPVTTISAFNFSDGGAIYNRFNNPWGDGIDPATGNVYVADTEHGQVEVFDPNGNYLATFGNTQLGGQYPYGVAVNSAGTTVYVLGSIYNNAFAYSVNAGSPPSYTYQFTFGNTGSGAAKLNSPYNLRVDNAGNVWVADFANSRVAEYSGSGTYLQAFTDPNTSILPSDLVWDGSGNLYVTDVKNKFVLIFNSSGAIVGQFGNGILSDPEGITTDGAGNFYVVDSNSGSGRIVVFH